MEDSFSRHTALIDNMLFDPQDTTYLLIIAGLQEITAEIEKALMARQGDIKQQLALQGTLVLRRHCARHRAVSTQDGTPGHGFGPGRPDPELCQHPRR